MFAAVASRSVSPRAAPAPPYTSAARAVPCGSAGTAATREAALYSNAEFSKITKMSAPPVDGPSRSSGGLEPLFAITLHLFPPGQKKGRERCKKSKRDEKKG